MYSVILSGNEYSLLVETKSKDAEHYVPAILLEHSTKRYSEIAQVLPKRIFEKGYLYCSYWVHNKNATIDDCLLSTVREWNNILFEGKYNSISATEKE